MSLKSVSKTRLILEAGELGVSCELKRHLSPKAVGSIIRALPVSGRARTGYAGMVYLETGVSSGMERPRRKFGRGDIAFLPEGGTIAFFYADSRPSRAMSIIGRVTGDAGALKGIGLGDMVRLRRAADAGA